MTFDGIINRTLIVDGNVLVDWQQKSDIIGRMKIELEDYLIDEVKKSMDLISHLMIWIRLLTDVLTWQSYGSNKR